MPYHLYLLSDPRTLPAEAYYIGITKNPKRRHTKHCEQVKRTRVSKRNQEIIRARKQPVMTVLETVEDKIDGLIREIVWIERFKNAGAQLLNREDRSWMLKRMEAEHYRQFRRSKR